MTKALGNEFHEKLSDLTECSICTEIFTNPKILPCVHTFCLHCLERHGKGKRPGNQMACPICRNEFEIPGKGLFELPNNFFIGKIVDIGKIATATATKAVCELCSEESAVAKMFCIDCQQKICHRCITLHGRIKQCQSHQVVELGSQLTVQNLNVCNSYCEHHPKEFIKMYCHEDNVAICLICFAESHQSHRCSNVDKAAGKFTEQLKVDKQKVADRNPECEEACQKLEKFKKEFTEEVLKTEEIIHKSGAELKELIDHHTEMLIQNVRLVKDRNLKCFEVAKQDVERFKIMIDSYQRYCDELLTIGSPVDVCRAANQMHKRAIDLEEMPANCNVGDFNCDQISFHCANIEILTKHHRPNNVVGELTVKKSSDRLIKFQKKISENDLPANWETMTNDEEFKTIQLSANTQEYQDIAMAVMSTAEKTVVQIVKIERIQNKTLYKKYVVRKAAMDTANPEAQNEMTLFYGAQTMEDTSQTEFSQRNYARGPLGNGLYFSKNFSYSAQNTRVSPAINGFKRVYQCKVLTGEMVGNRRILPPPKNMEKNLNYDSTVDNVANPSIFVTYCDSQAYPEYVIYFK